MHIIHTIEELQKITDLKSISDVFLYGSRAFKYNNPHSDWDYIVISHDAINGRQFNKCMMNITTYTPEHFQEKLDQNKPFAIECYMLPDEFKNVTSKFTLKLNNFEEEYNKKIIDDENKIKNHKGLNYIQYHKIKLFRNKLKMQLQCLKENKPFIFDLSKEYEKLRDD